MVASRWRGEWRDLDESARREAPGRFLQLSQGYTHYQMGGPRDSRAVVLVHGFSVPYFIWDPTFVFLSDAGLPVLRYDLFGRGFSDRPRAIYGMALYLEQLHEMLNCLGLEEVALVGLSMGGPIAAAYSLAHPERVGRLALIGPSGAKPIRLGPLYGLAALPAISDALFGIAGNNYMLNAISADFFDRAHVERFRERYRIQMEFRGFRRAILSTVRANMLGSFVSTYSLLGRSETPILLIWGENDKTVPFEHSDRLRRLLPQAEFFPVANAGHIPHFEQPYLVNPRLLEFLN